MRLNTKYKQIKHKAGIAQLGERQTEDLKVACSIHAHRIVFIIFNCFLLNSQVVSCTSILLLFDLFIIRILISM